MNNPQRPGPRARIILLLLACCLLPAAACAQRESAGSGAAPDSPVTSARRHDSYREYLDYLVDTLKKRWHYVPDSPGLQPELDLYIEMDRQGRIVSAKIVKPSGNKAFDRSCVAALKDIGALDPPPRDWPLTFTMSLSPAFLRK